MDKNKIINGSSAQIIELNPELRNIGYADAFKCDRQTRKPDTRRKHVSWILQPGGFFSVSGLFLWYQPCHSASFHVLSILQCGEFIAKSLKNLPLFKCDR